MEKIQPAEKTGGRTGKSYPALLEEQRSAQEYRRFEAAETPNRVEDGSHLPVPYRYTYERGPDGSYYVVGPEAEPEHHRVEASSGSAPHEGTSMVRAVPVSAAPSPREIRTSSQTFMTAAELRTWIHSEWVEREPSPWAVRGEAAYRSWDTADGGPDPRGRIIDRTI